MSEFRTRLLYNRWDQHARCVEVSVEVDGDWVTFCRISQSKSLMDDSEDEPTVNWCATGSQTTVMAWAASEALREAARVGLQFVLIKDWKCITPPKSGHVWSGKGAPEVFVEDGSIKVQQNGWCKTVAGVRSRCCNAVVRKDNEQGRGRHYKYTRTCTNCGSKLDSGMLLDSKQWEQVLLRMPKSHHISLKEKPDRVWTLIDQQFHQVPIQLVHNGNAFLEDEVHDWIYRNGVLRYYSRVVEKGHPCLVGSGVSTC